MAHFYRIDEWHHSGTSSKISFVDNLHDALEFTKGMFQVLPEVANGSEHVSIHEFNADSCDMAGWIHSDAEDFSPVTFISLGTVYSVKV
jgi:hypothetical protein